MKTELDTIPSTITISLGLKNRIRQQKGKMTYEQYLSLLLRQGTQDITTGSETSTLEVTEFERVSHVYTVDDTQILFDYNKVEATPQHIFDIGIRKVIKNGRKTMLNTITQGSVRAEYELYFALLESAVREETMTTFTHRGRFEDYGLWAQEFENMGLSQKALEYDVKDKLQDYENGAHLL